MLPFYLGEDPLSVKLAGVIGQKDAFFDGQVSRDERAEFHLWVLSEGRNFAKNRNEWPWAGRMRAKGEAQGFQMMDLMGGHRQDGRTCFYIESGSHQTML